VSLCPPKILHRPNKKRTRTSKVRSSTSLNVRSWGRLPFLYRGALQLTDTRESQLGAVCHSAWQETMRVTANTDGNPLMSSSCWLLADEKCRRFYHCEFYKWTQRMGKRWDSGLQIVCYTVHSYRETEIACMFWNESSLNTSDVSGLIVSHKIIYSPCWLFLTIFFHPQSCP
jgi:hypothetical protein